MEACDHAVAVERDVIAQSRRELRVGLDAIERAVEPRRNRALVRQIDDVGFDPRWRIETGEARRVREVGHLASPAARLVSYTNQLYQGDEMTRQKETLAITTPHVAGDEDIGEIRHIVGFHIRLAYGAVYRHFTETFAHLDMTQKQVSVLWLVGDHPDIAQTDLAQRMRMDRATTMTIVHRLESKGYLVRGKSKDDGRKQTLNLSKAGRKVLVTAKKAVQVNERWIKSRFSNKEVAKLVDMLIRIHE
jgi:DNA-binding MarR family transcriptional regulator